MIILRASARGTRRWLPYQSRTRLTGRPAGLADITHGHVADRLDGAYGTSPATVLPVGALATVAVAWWFYWPLV
jgi:uncharacterized protein (TIGR04206 family)